MKIALVHPKFDESGGAERYAVTLARGLALRGHEVHLFGRKRSGVPSSTTFHRIPALPFGRALKTYSFCWLARRRVNTARFDIVQGFGKTTCQSVHRAGGGVHRGYLEREGASSRARYDRVVVGIEDRLFASPALRCVICPSSWAAGEVKRHYSGASQRIRVIPNGVDTLCFRPDGRGETRPRLAQRLGIDPQDAMVLFVAANFRLKGLEQAIQGVARLERAHLVVVGGDDTGPFRSVAASQGILDRVHFLGARKDVAKLYQAADVLVHPTRYDPFSNVCLEAMACGTPIVTTRNNGAVEILGDGGGGRVLEDGWRTEDLAAAARALLDRGEIGRQEARSIALRHGIDEHVLRIESEYCRVCSEMAGTGQVG